MLSITRILEQRDPTQGGYNYVRIATSEADQFSKKSKTRLLATFNGELAVRCGLNSLGDGNFFIMLSREKCALLGAVPGTRLDIDLEEDPNPLGVEIPAFLLSLLEENPSLKTTFDALTDGGKRTLIHGVLRIKGIEKQLQKTVEWLTDGVPVGGRNSKKNGR